MFFMNPQNPMPQFAPNSGGTDLSQASRLIGQEVRINRGGPDSIQGRLIAVNRQVLVLRVQGRIVFVNGRHVKSITKVGSSGGKSGHSKGRSGGQSGGHSGGRSGQNAGFIQSPTFSGVLAQLRGQFVQINSGGPEKLEGFLAETNNQFATLLVGREIVLVPIHHIRTVSVAARSHGGKSGKSGKSGNHSSGGHNQSGSGGRRSGSHGNRSHGRG